MQELLGIGYSGTIITSHVVCVMPSGSSGARRLREVSRKAGKLVDATQGHKARSVIITESDHVILSALQAETISHRMK